MKILFVVSIGKAKYYVGPDLQRAFDWARKLGRNRVRNPNLYVSKRPITVTFEAYKALL